MPVYIVAILVSLSFIGGFGLARTPIIGSFFDPKPEEKTSETNVATPNNSETTTANKTADQKEKQQDNNSQNSSQNNQSDQSNSTSEQNSSSTILTQTEVNNFDNQTRKSISMVIDNKNLFTSNSSTPEARLQILKEEVFDNENLQSIVILEIEKPESTNKLDWSKWKKMWIDEVKKYQQNQLGFQDGIISPNGDTHKTIKKQLKERRDKIISRNVGDQ